MTNPNINPFVKVSRARDNQGEGERWSAEQVHPTLNAFDSGDARCVCAVVSKKSMGGRQVYPINSMILGKDGSDFRQTFGVGANGDTCPTLQTGHHHVVAICQGV